MTICSRWNDDNTPTAIHHALYLQCRDMMQREPSPTASVIESQSVNSAEKGGATVIRTATMQASKSRARTAISFSVRLA